MEVPARILLILGLFQMIIHLSVCAPVNPKNVPNPDPVEGHPGDEEPYLSNLEYENYLREVVAVLEEDPDFRKELEAANVSDIKTGLIARHLEKAHHSIREKLDEIKRKEIERLKKLVHEQIRDGKGVDSMKKDFTDHIDVRNVHSFQAEDLKKLIMKATADLDELDKKRREEFKEYEVEKEVERRHKLQAMDEEKRKQAEKEFEELQKKHKDHPKLHHPGSKDQLEEVWEKKDHMDPEDFDPKTFFKMHDTDGDGNLDQEEVEALFQSELDKVYDPNAPEDDQVERYEEMARMREHVVKELDADKNGMVSLDEFLRYTGEEQFKNDEGWDDLDGNKEYTEEDIKNYEKMLKEHEERLLKQGVRPGGGAVPGEINIPPRDPNVAQMNMAPGGPVGGHPPGMGAQPLHQQQQQDLKFQPQQHNQPNQQQFQQPNQQQFQQPNQQQFQQPNQQQFQQPNQQQFQQPNQQQFQHQNQQQLHQQNVQQQQMNINAQQQQQHQQNQQQGIPQQHIPQQNKEAAVPAV